MDSFFDTPLLTQNEATLAYKWIVVLCQVQRNMIKTKQNKYLNEKVEICATKAQKKKRKNLCHLKNLHFVKQKYNKKNNLYHFKNLYSKQPKQNKIFFTSKVCIFPGKRLSFGRFKQDWGKKSWSRSQADFTIH